MSAEEQEEEKEEKELKKVKLSDHTGGRTFPIHPFSPSSLFREIQDTCVCVSSRSQEYTHTYILSRKERQTNSNNF